MRATIFFLILTHLKITKFLMLLVGFQRFLLLGKSRFELVEFTSSLDIDHIFMSNRYSSICCFSG